MKFFTLFLIVLSAFVYAHGQRRPVPIEVAPEWRAPQNTDPGRDRVVRTANVGRVRSSSSEAYALEQRAFDLVNAERRVRGVAPLKWSSDLSELARIHSQNMAAAGFFSHRGKDGSLVDDRAERLGMNSWAAIGENIAYIRGYERPADLAVEKWMQSTSHRNNLLSNRWLEAAIGVEIADNGTLYFTQVFILRN